MHTLGYVRISRPESQDPASQIKLIQERGIVVDDIFVDAASGVVPPLKRPSYAKMMARIEEGGISELIVSEFSRIGRTVQESLMEVLSIQKRGIKIISLSKSESMINDLPVGLQPVIISAMMYSAQLERDHIRERTKWGIENAKLKGKKIGRPQVVVDFDGVKKMMEEKFLKEAQAIRVLGIKPRTYYAAKKKRAT
jgi:putative DNA-invertase from lambdoid prophage Rac